MEIYENLDLNDLENETWKEICGYNGDYFVSNLGRIKSFKRCKEGKILTPVKDTHGYFQIGLSKNGKKKHKLIHTLIYETFNNYKLKKNECVHHIDENEINNILENFELMTKKEHTGLHHKNKTISEKTRKLMSENHVDVKGEKNPMYGKHQSEESKNKISKKLKGKSKGENNSQSTLKEGEVWLIKKILNSDYYKSGKINQTYIGKMFKVSIQTISKIKNNKSWKHITL